MLAFGASGPNAKADLSNTKPVRVGAASGPEKTSAFGINGTDLGIPWQDAFGRTQVIFGDTSSATNRLCDHTQYNDVQNPDPYWPLPFHRLSASASVAWTTDNNLSNGISYSDAIRDDDYFGAAIYNTGHTIPSGAAAIGTTDIVHFASTSFDNYDGFQCPAGTFGVNSGFMGTRTSTASIPARFERNDAFGTWGPTSNFAQATLLHDGNFLYMFGITAGRTGGIKLARALAPQAPSGLAWKYWTGSAWSDSELDAGFIVPPPVGELSASYNAALGRYIIAYLDGQSGSIVYRDARTPSGPWSQQKTLVTHKTSPFLYGSFIYPPEATDDPSALFFNMSNWIKSGGTHDCYHSTHYNVSLYKSSLSFATAPASTSLGEVVTDPDFDRILCTSTMQSTCGATELSKILNIGDGRWIPIPLTAAGCPGCPLDRNPEVTVSRNYLGAPTKVNLSGEYGWRGVAQRVAVRPWSKYTVRFTGAWSNAEAYIGVHTIPNVEWIEASTLPELGKCRGVQWPTAPLTQLAMGATGTNGARELVVYTGGDTLVELFGGYVGTGSPGNMTIDSLTLRPSDVTSDGGFEMQGPPGTDLAAPYLGEGPGTKHIGDWGMPGNAIELADQQAGTWNAVTQLVTVRPGVYRLHADVASGGNFSIGYMGVRTTSGAILAETSYGDDPYYHEREVYFTVGGTADTQLRLFVGYWSGFSQSLWSNVVVDNIGLEEVSL